MPHPNTQSNFKKVYSLDRAKLISSTLLTYNIPSNLNTKDLNTIFYYLEQLKGNDFFCQLCSEILLRWYQELTSEIKKRTINLQMTFVLSQKFFETNKHRKKCRIKNVLHAISKICCGIKQVLTKYKKVPSSKLDRD